MIDPYTFGVKLAGGGATSAAALGGASGFMAQPAPRPQVPFNQQQAVSHMIDRKIPGVGSDWYGPARAAQAQKRYTALGNIPPGRSPNRFQREAGQFYNSQTPGAPIPQAVATGPTPPPAATATPTINPLQH